MTIGLQARPTEGDVLIRVTTTYGAATQRQEQHRQDVVETVEMDAPYDLPGPWTRLRVERGCPGALIEPDTRLLFYPDPGSGLDLLLRHHHDKYESIPVEHRTQDLTPP